MKITGIAKVGADGIAVSIGEGDDERVFYLCLPADIRDHFADLLAAWMVNQNMKG